MPTLYSAFNRGETACLRLPGDSGSSTETGACTRYATPLTDAGQGSRRSAGRFLWVKL